MAIFDECTAYKNALDYACEFISVGTMSCPYDSFEFTPSECREGNCKCEDARLCWKEYFLIRAAGD